MSNPHGKREERGPTLTLGELFGGGKSPPKPDCRECDNGRKSAEQVNNGDSRRQMCLGCGRVLMSDWA